MPAPVITKLVPELLLEIFCSLRNFNDALAFSECSKLLKDVYESNRIAILRKILIKSGTYNDDIKLHGLIRENRGLAAVYETYGTGNSEAYDPRAAQRPTGATELQPFLNSEPRLTDTDIDDIFTRSMALIGLEKLYANPEIRFRYLGSPFATQGDRSFAPRTRFRRAIIKVWLAQEARLYGMTMLGTQDERDRAAEFVRRELWTFENIPNGEDDVADVEEVDGFIYGFIMGQIFGAEMDTWKSWIDGVDPQRVEIFDEGYDSSRELFMIYCWSVLRPIDIWDLYVTIGLRTSEPGVFPKDKPRYLVERGWFDLGYPNDNIDWWSSYRRSWMKALEQTCEYE